MPTPTKKDLWKFQMNDELHSKKIEQELKSYKKFSC